MPKRRTKKVRPTRETIYPEVEVKVCEGEHAITVQQAKSLLGWEEETEEQKFQLEYLVKDFHRKKIRCTNNINNRPLSMKNLASLQQEILRGRWVFNGEPIIIGKTGLILNGQHSLVALVLGHQQWCDNPDKFEHPEEPRLEKLVVCGVEESDKVVNTMDTCKPRSLSDVLYRSEFFASTSPKERKVIARVCSYAVNTLWERMGAEYAFAPRQTHSEALDFLAKHPKVLEAVKFIVVENGDDTIARYLSLGYAAGMLYLMGCSTTDPDVYILDPTETSLDWTNWEKACRFFTLISSESKVIEPLRTALGLLLEETGGSRKERFALIAKTWNSWINNNGKISSIGLSYKVQDGIRTLVEEPSVGGIDLVEFKII